MLPAWELFNHERAGASLLPALSFFHSFYSSDDTEFIRRFLAEAITHGFTRRRPIRSIQIPPESGICPTDFTDVHRFFG